MQTETIIHTPKSDAALQMWPQFTEDIRLRLESGKRAYGDSSFESPLERMITEIQQELLDVSGWSFIQWQRLEGLREKIRTVEAAAHSSCCSSGHAAA